MKQFLIDDNIDWKELRKQKETLLNVIGDLTHTGKGEIVSDLDGILHLIDHIQDSAVTSGIWTEEEIFGKTENP